MVLQRRIALDGVQQLVWWLFQSSAGGPTRVRVVRALRERPRNAQQLSEALDLDYTTVRHQLRVLQRNHRVQAVGDRYGQTYFVAPSLEGRWAMIEPGVAKEAERRGKGE